jgi:hypothetical protein
MGAIAVLRLRLHPGPQLLDERVGPGVRLQHTIVATVMRPVVGFAERDVHHTRLVSLEMRHRETEGVDVVPDRVPGRGRQKLLRAQLAYERIGMVERFKTRVDRKRTRRVLCNRVEDAPGCEHAGLRRRKLEPCLQLFKYRHIRIAQWIVALDRVVMCLSEQYLGVARIGKAMRVRQGH